MQFRIFRCGVCGHRMTVGRPRCGYCHSRKPFYRKVWPYALVLAILAFFAGTTALSFLLPHATEITSEPVRSSQSG